MKVGGCSKGWLLFFLGGGMGSVGLLPFGNKQQGLVFWYDTGL